MEIRSRLASLPARPPTPPKALHRTTQGDAVAAERYTAIVHQALDTPAESPGSVDFPPGSSGRAHKRVGFVLDSPALVQSVRTLLRPSAAKKPSKSILKTSSNPPSSDPIEPDSPSPKVLDFPTMLQHTLAALANQDLSTRFDAYMSLNGCLKAYSDLPSQEELVAKTPALADCAFRDVTEPQHQEGIRSSRLIAEALKVATTLMWKPSTAVALPSGFQARLANQAIACLSDASYPKTLILSFLHMFTVFKFSPQSISNERVNQLLAVLKDIDSRISGRRTLFLRLLIYQRLVQQEHPAMTGRLGDWIGHMFEALQDETSDIREKAIALGTVAGNAFGTVEPVSNFVRKLLDANRSDKPNSPPYVSSFADNLMLWLSSEATALQVPKIWIIPLLFLRSDSMRLTSWSHFNTWMAVINRCLNTSNIKLRCFAYCEWSRLIYCMQLGLLSSDKTLSFLRYPIKKPLQKLNLTAGKDAKLMRQYVLSAYWNLVHFALRPGQTDLRLDRSWAECVGSMISSPIKTSLIDFDSVCRMMPALLGDDGRPYWDSDRGNRSAMKPEDLSRIDPRWVRSRSDSVVRTIEAIMLSDAWATASNGGEKILKVWTSFLTAIRDAASKEIKVSNDTMKAVVTITTSLKSVIVHSFTSDMKSDRCEGMTRFTKLICAAAEIIGPLAFTEKRLVSESTSLQVVDTLSTKSHHSGTQLTSSVHYLVGILLKDATKESSTPEFTACIQTLIDIVLLSYTSSQARIEALNSLLQDHIPSGDLACGSEQAMWDTVIKATIQLLNNPSKDTPAEAGETPGRLFRAVVNILETGVTDMRLGSSSSWLSLLETLDQAVCEAAGAGLASTLLTEPLAGAFKRRGISSDSSLFLEMFTGLLAHARWPGSQKAVDMSHRSLWGLVGPKRVSMNPFDTLYGQCAIISEMAYQSMSSYLPSHLARLLDGLTALIRICNVKPASIPEVLTKLQPAFAPWISDTEGKLTTDNQDATMIFTSVTELWSCITNKMKRMEAFDTASFQKLEVALRCGVISRHRAILGRTISFWNDTFGASKDLDYSEDFRKMIFRLTFIVDISLPGTLASQHDSSIEIDSFNFVDTPVDPDCLKGSALDVGPSVKAPFAVSTNKNTSLLASRTLTKNVEQLTADSHGNVLKKRAAKTTPRLRHDDSQIQFAAIESPPGQDQAIGSQLLTARQKEVRERQDRESSTMFPDLHLGSEPGSYEPATQYRRHQGSARPSGQENQKPSTSNSSPALAKLTSTEPLLNSSPTPSGPRTARQAASELARPLPQDYHHEEIDTLREDIPSSPPVPLPKRRYLSKKSKSDSAKAKAPNFEGTGLSAQDTNASAMQTRRSSRLGEKDSASPVELTGVQAADEAADIDFEDIKHRALGAQPNAPVPPASEDDESLITSQIAMEIQRAASLNASSFSEDTTQQASGRSGNEEATAGPDAKLPKKRGLKRKYPLQPTTSQASQPADEEVLDCIIVSSSASKSRGSPKPVAVGVSTRGRKKRVLKEGIAVVKTGESQSPRPAKRARLSSVDVDDNIVLTSDPVKPLEQGSSQGIPASEVVDTSGPALEAHVPTDEGSIVIEEGEASTTPPKTTVTEEGAKRSLLREAEGWLERVKQGVRPAERMPLMRTFTEMMRLAMAE